MGGLDSRGWKESAIARGTESVTLEWTLCRCLDELPTIAQPISLSSSSSLVTPQERDLKCNPSPRWQCRGLVTGLLSVSGVEPLVVLRLTGPSLPIVFGWFGPLSLARVSRCRLEIGLKCSTPPLLFPVWPPPPTGPAVGKGEPPVHGLATRSHRLIVKGEQVRNRAIEKRLPPVGFPTKAKATDAYRGMAEPLRHRTLPNHRLC